MIVRIMGEGQLEVADSDIESLNTLDDEVQSAVESGGQERFSEALRTLLDRVRAVGSPVAAESLQPSQLILPPADASLDDVREILGDEGLIPG